MGFTYVYFILPIYAFAFTKHLDIIKNIKKKIKLTIAINKLQLYNFKNINIINIHNNNIKIIILLKILGSSYHEP